VKLDRIDVYSLSARLDRPFGWSQRWTDVRGMTVVRLTSSDGIVAWGECGSGIDARASVEALAALVLRHDPMLRERIWQQLFSASYQGHGFAGPSLSAVSAFDMALWDLAGKALDRPVSDLLGGSVRESVPVYATGLYYLEDDFPGPLIEEALGYVAQGFSGVKMKVGGKAFAEDVRRVLAVREAIGPDIRLMIDANEGYSASTAIAFARAVREAHLTWFEEPCASYDDSSNVLVNAETDVPISGGEGLRTRHEFAPRLARRVFDIVQPDVVNVGGISELALVGRMANSFGILMNPHFWGTGISFAASLHVCACHPPTPPSTTPEPYASEPVLEFDQTPHPVRRDLTPGFAVEASRIAVPKGPGLGVEVDEGALARYTEGGVTTISV
jgi:D-galactarolactone cycloisomerase